FIAEALGEQRTDGAVNLAAGEDLLLRGPAFALDVAAGEAAAGVGVLAVVHGERKEVNALAGLIGAGGGGQDHGVAQADNDGAACLAGDFSGFEGKGFPSGKFNTDAGRHEMVSSFWASGAR